MISPLRYTRTKYFLALMLIVVFLAVSLRQSSHVHHQHDSADPGFTSGSMSFVAVFSDGHGGDAEHHGKHSHEAPAETAHLYKHKSSWKTLRTKADGENKGKIPAFFCTQDIAIIAPEANTAPAPSVWGGRGVSINCSPPGRAPPFTFCLT